VRILFKLFSADMKLLYTKSGLHFNMYVYDR